MTVRTLSLSSSAPRPQRKDNGTKRQVKVLVLEREHFSLLLRGEARVRNLPGDADVVSASHYGNRLGFMVYSASYPHAEQDQPLPLVRAVMERR
jgi:hypothetical protein